MSLLVRNYIIYTTSLLHSYVYYQGSSGTNSGSAGAAIGGALGGIMFFVIVILLVLCFLKHSRRRKSYNIIVVDLTFLNLMKLVIAKDRIYC